MTDAIIHTLQDYPWLPWVWLVATLAATAIRVGWPEERDRPRWMVALLAVCDVLQANLSGPAKLVSRKPQP